MEYVPGGTRSMSEAGFYIKEIDTMGNTDSRRELGSLSRNHSLDRSDSQQ